MFRENINMMKRRYDVREQFTEWWLREGVGAAAKIMLTVRVIK